MPESAPQAKPEQFYVPRKGWYTREQMVQMGMMKPAEKKE